MVEAIEAYLAGINHELAVFLVAMIPIIELRGAIPFGIITLDMQWYVVLFLGVLGNVLPVPFIVWFFRPIINYLEKTRLFGKLAKKLKTRTNKKMNNMENEVSGITNEKSKYRKKLLGLFVFVAVPLPGTGAWTGSAIAALMGLRIKHSFWVIAAGVLTAGIIMLTGSTIIDGIISVF
ncbi:MAG: small multi-drug export protein [Clostridia bacterium]|nr:small multi-drug export protein [Clostridia bacterium]